jgi:hypothetical protein
MELPKADAKIQPPVFSRRFPVGFSDHCCVGSVMVTSVAFVATFAAAGGADGIVLFYPAVLKNGCAALLRTASMLSGNKSAGFVV